MYRILWPWLLALVQRLGSVDLATAEDIAQETVLHLFRSARLGGEFEDPALFRGYVRRIAHNLLIDRIRALQRRPPAELLSNEIADRQPDPESLQITADLVDRVRGQLSPSEARLAQFLAAGYSAPELAKELNRSIGTVYNDISRLRSRIRAIAAAYATGAK